MDLLVEEGDTARLAVGDAHRLDLIEVRELVAVIGDAVVVGVFLNDNSARFGEGTGLNHPEWACARALSLDIDLLLEELTGGESASQRSAEAEQLVGVRPDGLELHGLSVGRGYRIQPLLGKRGLQRTFVLRDSIEPTQNI